MGCVHVTVRCSVLQCADAPVEPVPFDISL